MGKKGAPHRKFSKEKKLKYIKLESIPRFVSTSKMVLLFYTILEV